MSSRQRGKAEGSPIPWINYHSILLSQLSDQVSIHLGTPRNHFFRYLLIDLPGTTEMTVGDNRWYGPVSQLRENSHSNFFLFYVVIQCALDLIFVVRFSCLRRQCYEVATKTRACWKEVIGYKKLERPRTCLPPTKENANPISKGYRPKVQIPLNILPLFARGILGDFQVALREHWC